MVPSSILHLPSSPQSTTSPPHHLTTSPAAEQIDLHTLVGQFIALRHDVNLQTKATRVQQELNTESLRQLGQAVDTLRQTQAAAHSRTSRRRTKVSDRS